MTDTHNETHSSAAEQGMDSLNAVLSIVQNADPETMDYLGLSENDRLMMLNQPYSVCVYQSSNHSASCVFNKEPNSVTIGFSKNFESKTPEEQIGIAGQQLATVTFNNMNQVEKHAGSVLAGSVAVVSGFLNEPVLAMVALTTGYLANNYHNYEQSLNACRFNARLQKLLSPNTALTSEEEGELENSKTLASFWENNVVNRLVHGGVKKKQSRMILLKEKKNNLTAPAKALNVTSGNENPYNIVNLDKAYAEHLVAF